MRLNIDFERMKEIYGDEIEEIINENIDIIEKNIRFLNDLKFKTAKNKNIEIINAGTDLKSNKHCANSLCVIFKIL